MRSEALLVVINGPMFAGKDTLADDLVAVLQTLNGRETRRITFSDVLCEEAERGLAALRMAREDRTLDPVTEVELAVPLARQHARKFVSLLWPELVARPQLTVRERTSGTREVLQRLGSAWRPDSYWALEVHRRALAAVNAGHNMVVVGARYRTEFDLFRQSGAITVRLDVNRDAQVERAIKRDGHAPTAEQFDHPGEHALDDATFTIRFDTSTLTSAQVLDRVVDRLNACLHSTFF